MILMSSPAERHLSARYKPFAISYRTAQIAAQWSVDVHDLLSEAVARRKLYMSCILACALEQVQQQNTTTFIAEITSRSPIPLSSCRKKGSTKSWLLLQTAYVQMPVITFQDASRLTINIEYICII